MNRNYDEMVNEIAKLEEKIGFMPEGVIRCYKDKGKYPTRNPILYLLIQM